MTSNKIVGNYRSFGGKAVQKMEVADSPETLAWDYKPE
jgi:hypothetical protein